MQMSKAILRNSEIVIFDKKIISVSSFSKPLDRKQIIFHVGLMFIYLHG